MTDRFRVAVLDDYQGLAPTLAGWAALGSEVDVEFFRHPIAQADLPTTLGEFDALVLMRERTAFRRPILEALPKLRLLVTTGMRNASVDIAYLRQRGVVVSGTGGSGGPPAPGI